MVNFVTHVKIRIMDHPITTLDRDYRNSASYLRHKSQRLWQILFPMLLTGMILLAVAILVVIGAAKPDGSEAASQWADTSLIWLIIPMMLFAFVATLLLIALIILMGKIVHVIPNYTFEAQRYGNIVSSQIKLISNKLTAPIIGVDSFLARVSAFFSALLGRTRD